MRTIYKNGRVFRTDTLEFEYCDVAVENGKVAEIAGKIEAGTADRVEDMSGLTLLPGLVDVHVHLREPGFSEKETIRTGTLSAANGGYSCICPMPNLNPAPDADDTLGIQEKMIAEQAIVKVIPYGCITMGQKGAGELVNFETLAPRVVGFSDDGRGVQRDGLMEDAMRICAKLDKPIVAHCEVDELVRGGYIHDGEYCKTHGHKGICSESEWQQVERDIALSEKTGCQYHVCHVSTKESVQLLREAIARGAKVSGETAPHYLLLTDMEIEEDGRFKMNPPIRSKADQTALIEGIMDGTLACIATDHAPHTAEQKNKGLAGSAFGIVGLETAFPLMYRHFVVAGRMTIEKLIDLMAIAPRRLFNLDGGIKVGDCADFVAWDLEQRYKVDPEQFLSKGRATPFTGWEVQGKVMLNVVKGKQVLDNRK